jgi:dihydroorotase
MGRRPGDVAALAGMPEVVALSDDGDPVVDPEVMATVCRLAAAARVPLAPHCEDSPRALDAFERGEDPGFRPGEPYTNEARYVRRDLGLAAQFGCRIHFSHVSLADTVAAIGAAPSGARVTFEATPHHLLLCREDYAPGEAPTVNPPIRSEADRRALREAVLSGQCDVIASDHAPHTAQDKAAGACGLVGLETTLGLVLTHFVQPGLLSPADAVGLMSAAPARVFGLPGGTLSAGSAADMVLVEPEREWTVQPEAFRSRSRNTPYAGWTLRGKAVATWVGGEPVYREDGFGARSGDEDLRGRN